MYSMTVDIEKLYRFTKAMRDMIEYAKKKERKKRKKGINILGTNCIF